MYLSKTEKHLNQGLICCIIIIAVLITGCGARTGESQQVNDTAKKIIRLSHSHPASFSSELHLTAWIFKHFVEDHSENIEVRIYPVNGLGQEREVYEAMQLGSGANCIISGTAILNNFIPEFSVLDLPYLWKDYHHVHNALDGQAGKMLENHAEPYGFKVLAWLDSWGYRHLVLGKEIDSVDDLSGLKIRTIQSNTYIKAINAMGMNATPMAFGEVYSAMQTGILDGFEHNATVIRANKFYEVSKQIVLTKHLFGTVVFIYSLKDWNNLTPDEQDLIQEAANMARDIQRSLAPLREKEALGFLEEQGMDIKAIDTEYMENITFDLQQELAEKNNCLGVLDKIRGIARPDHDQN
jgi:tripartite ATP-independent transporter DctP family solute receptor